MRRPTQPTMGGNRTDEALLELSTLVLANCQPALPLRRFDLRRLRSGQQRTLVSQSKLNGSGQRRAPVENYDLGGL